MVVHTLLHHYAPPCPNKLTEGSKEKGKCYVVHSLFPYRCTAPLHREEMGVFWWCKQGVTAMPHQGQIDRQKEST